MPVSSVLISIQLMESTLHDATVIHLALLRRLCVHRPILPGCGELPAPPRRRRSAVRPTYSPRMRAVRLSFIPSGVHSCTIPRALLLLHRKPLLTLGSLILLLLQPER